MAEDYMSSSDAFETHQVLCTSLMKKEPEQCQRLTFILAPQDWGLKSGVSFLKIFLDMCIYKLRFITLQMVQWILGFLIYIFSLDKPG